MNIPTKELIAGTTRRILRDNGVSPQFTDAQIHDAIQYAQEQIVLGSGKTREYLDASFQRSAAGNTMVIPNNVFKVLDIEQA